MSAADDLRHAADRLDQAALDIEAACEVDHRDGALACCIAESRRTVAAYYRNAADELDRGAA